MPIALLDLRGQYEDGVVRFTWRCPDNVPEFVYVIPTRMVDGRPELDVRKALQQYIRDSAYGLAMPVSASTAVKSYAFCIYAAEQDEEPNRAQLSKDSFWVHVVVGEAELWYSLTSSDLRNGLIEWRITLNSSAVINHGIIGYSYFCGDTKISVPFPDAIQQRKKTYIPIYLPRNVQLQIEPLTDCGDNFDISSAGPFHIHTKFLRRK